MGKPAHNHFCDYRNPGNCRVRKLSCENVCVEILLWTGDTTKIYYCEHLHMLQNNLRKWQITQGVSVVVAFKCIALSGRRLLGKCLTEKQNQKDAMVIWHLF